MLTRELYKLETRVVSLPVTLVLSFVVPLSSEGFDATLNRTSPTHEKEERREEREPCRCYVVWRPSMKTMRLYGYFTFTVTSYSSVARERHVFHLNYFDSDPGFYDFPLSFVPPGFQRLQIFCLSCVLIYSRCGEL